MSLAQDMAASALDETITIERVPATTKHFKAVAVFILPHYQCLRLSTSANGHDRQDGLYETGATVTHSKGLSLFDAADPRREASPGAVARGDQAAARRRAPAAADRAGVGERGRATRAATGGRDGAPARGAQLLGGRRRIVGVSRPVARVSIHRRVRVHSGVGVVAGGADGGGLLARAREDEGSQHREQPPPRNHQQFTGNG